MKPMLVVGLGNIGDKYAETRHNIGFKILDAYAEAKGLEWQPSNFGLVANFKYRGRPVRLLKPDTYVNLSGKAAQYHARILGISPERVYILTDEIHLPFGTIKIKGKGSSGGHNGHKSVAQELQTEKYPRLRFGVGSTFSEGKQVDYVLGEWSAEERLHLGMLIEASYKSIETLIFRGISEAMNTYNKNYLDLDPPVS